MRAQNRGDRIPDGQSTCRLNAPDIECAGKATAKEVEPAREIRSKSTIVTGVKPKVVEICCAYGAEEKEYCFGHPEQVDKGLKN
jgi:hypothetical protein